LDYVEQAGDRLDRFLSKYSRKLTEAEITRVKSLRDKLTTCTLEIAAFGLVSRGKTALLNALAGKKIGETGATHGTTQAIAAEFWTTEPEDQFTEGKQSDFQNNDRSDSSTDQPESINIDPSSLNNFNDRANQFANPTSQTDRNTTDSNLEQSDQNEQQDLVDRQNAYVVQYSHKARLKLVDTPGLDEIEGEERAKMAIATAREADLILFVVAGDINRTEHEALKLLKQTGKPLLLVFNKVDLYLPDDRQAIYESLQRIAADVGIAATDIVFASAEPLPVKVRIQYAVGADSDPPVQSHRSNSSNLPRK
jgi:GTPase SAR1 family protein